MRDRYENNSGSSFILLLVALFVGVLACFGALEGSSSITSYDDEFVEAAKHNP